MDVTFTDPIYLLLTVVVPLVILTHFFSLKYVKKRALRFANFEALRRVSGGEKIQINWTLLIFRLLIMAFLILSAAGATLWYQGRTSLATYVLAIDSSGSMLADDFKPSRFEAAKASALAFVESLDAQTKIGVVSFSGVGETEQGVTLNKGDVKNAISSLKIKSISGTAIGEAIKVSMNLLAEELSSKSIILLTDGRENILTEDELMRVVQIAKENKLTIHVIGIGTESGGNIPGIEVTSTIDDSLLQKIAKETGGNYIKADNEAKLKNSYFEISSSAAAKIPMRLRLPLLIMAVALLFVEWGLINTKFKLLP